MVRNPFGLRVGLHSEGNAHSLVKLYQESGCVRVKWPHLNQMACSSIYYPAGGSVQRTALIGTESSFSIFLPSAWEKGALPCETF